MIKHKNWLAYVMVTAWLLFTLVAFWWFQFKNIQSFSPSPTSEQRDYFKPSGLAQQLAQISQKLDDNTRPDQATVFHFWNPDCPCSRFNTAHVRAITRQYSTKGVRFIVIPHPGVNTNFNDLKEQAESNFGTTIHLIRAGEVHLPSSPAAAVIGNDGQLAYFGPYSIGASCSATSGTFVEKTLDSILAGEHMRNINTAATGCYCDWKHWSKNNVI